MLFKKPDVSKNTGLCLCANLTEELTAGLRGKWRDQVPGKGAGQGQPAPAHATAGGGGGVKGTSHPIGRPGVMKMAGRKRGSVPIAGQSQPPKHVRWQEQAEGERATKLNESKAAYQRVQKETADLPKSLEGKCVATDGGKTVSGYKGKYPRKLPKGYSEATPSQIKAYSERIGHHLAAKKPNFMDGLDKDGNTLPGADGWAGKYNSVHAEKQLSFLKPNDPIAVNIAMCPDCQDFFRLNAKYLKQDQIVTDPDGSWLYQPDGTVFCPDGTMVAADAPLHPPKADVKSTSSQLLDIVGDALDDGKP